MAILVSTNDERIRDEPGSSTTVTAPQATVTARWSRSYARALVVSDFVVVALALVASTLVGSQPYTLPLLHGEAAISVWAVVGLIAVILHGGLSMTGSRSARVVGVGTQEYRAILYSCFLSFTSVALVAYVASLAGLHFILLVGLVDDDARSAADAVGVCGDGSSRSVGRAGCRTASCSSGSEASVAQTARDLQRSPAAGLHVVGACTSSGRVADYIPGTDIPVSGSVVEHHRGACRASMPTRCSSAAANELSPRTVRELSWALEPGRQHLIVAPSLTDIGGPRLHTRPVAGLPLVHVETPRYGGGKLYGKRAFDVLAAGLLILLLSPILLGLGPGREDHEPRRGVLPAGAHRPQRRDVPDAEVPLDVHRRRGAPARPAARGARPRQRRHVQDEGRPAGHERRQDPATLQPRRAAAAVQRLPRRDVARRPAAAAGPRSAAVLDSRCTGASSSSPASRDCGRSAAAATSTGKRLSASTCSTSRTGR